MNKKQQTKETVINFLMQELKLSREESKSRIEEMEKFGLLNFRSSGKLYIKVV